MNRTVASLVVSLSCCLGVCTLSGSSADEQAVLKDTRQPSVDGDDVLRRFVDELVEITPGSGRFPRSVTVPSSAASLRPPADFRISRYETTQELFRVVTGKDPSRWKGPRNSVESVSRQDVDRFCSELTAILRKAGLIGSDEVVRLPTDVEWEYCCRAGSLEPFCFGALNDSEDTLDQYAWHTGNAAGNDPAVGVLRPNAYGLYDVHGYLWEYVDVESDNRDAPRVAWVMGGSWRDPGLLLASDSRKSISSDAGNDAVGFRCVVARQSNAVQDL